MEYSDCSFSFELAGDEGIYVDTLAITMDSVVGILKEIVNESEPDALVRLKVTKFDTGSFDIDFLALVETAKSVVTDAKVLATGVVSILTSIIGVKQFLKGNKPKEVKKVEDGKIQITNESGEVMTTEGDVKDTLFNNCRVDNFIVNIFNGIDKEEGKTALNIYDHTNKPLISIPKSDFSNMKTPIYDSSLDVAGTYINNLTTTLQVRKPDLTGKSKWGFILDRYIDATKSEGTVPNGC